MTPPPRLEEVRAGRLAVAALALVLSACETIPEAQCPKVDWYALGVEDGRAGYSAERLADHRKACDGVRVEPDERAWLEGRRAGLTEYCAPPRAIENGLAGRGYAGVCSDPRYGRLYRAARRVHDARAKVAEIDRDLASARRDLASNEQSGVLRRQVTGLANDRARAVDEALEAQRALDALRRELRA